MRVLYDYQAFLQRQGGVSRYFAELIRALQQLPGFQAEVPVFFSDNEYLSARKTLFTRRHFKGKERLMAVLNQRPALRALSGSFDVFHPTYYRPYFLSGLRRPFVLTVHDMIHEVFGHDHVRDDGTAAAKRLLCRRASRIIAVSQSTKNDLCRLLDVPEEKVSVIHHATSLTYSGGPRVHEKPYLLFVGARSGYKNFTRFLEAAAGVLLRQGVEVVCVGGGSFSQDEIALIRSLHLSGRVTLRDAGSPGALANLYHFAQALCYPSLYEGFGFPLLEAFACECPVAAGRTSSLPEVAGDAAAWFEPESVSSIRAAIERILTDDTERRRLIASGTERVRAFSWNESARKTLEVYQQAL